MGGVYSSGLTSNSKNKKSVDENNSMNHIENNKNCDKEIINNENIKKNQSLDEFKKELKIKRELRQSAIFGLKKEILDLRQSLLDVKTIKKMDQTTSTDDLNDSFNNLLRKQLAESQFELQQANSDILTLTEETDVLKKQVLSLKEVITISKTMISIREDQVDQLKSKLTEIEESLAERELKTMSDDLRKEYDRQLENIRNLKALYEERSRVSSIEKDNLRMDLERSQADFEAEKIKTKNLEEYVLTLQADVEKLSSEIWETKGKLTETKSISNKFESEITTINKLSSQILMGFSSGDDINIDKLTKVLDENRELLSEMTINEGTTEGSVLPKLLFDLVIQSKADDENQQIPSTSTFATTNEIIVNLPKVWRILMEFLNHQKKVPLTELGDKTDCYKSILTDNGPELVISVSKTFIKLKDLILEKKSLQNETNRLKTLNVHLDSRLQTQEKRLGAVTLELTKTWHIVGKLQRQHRQLHTNEQILRYQLQQKRRVLNELKDELEYCRHKWALAREKNNETEIQWKSMKQEFKQRRLIDLQSSAESGYSDSDSEIEIEEKKIPIDDLEVEEFINQSKKQETVEEMFYRLSCFSSEPSTSKNSIEKKNNGEILKKKNQSPLTESEEEYTARRSERLQRLEEQCRQLITNVTQTVDRGEQINTQLDGIQQRYGIRNIETVNNISDEQQENDENIEN